MILLKELKFEPCVVALNNTNLISVFCPRLKNLKEQIPFKKAVAPPEKQ